MQNINNWSFWIRKKNALLNLIREQDAVALSNKIYLYSKDLNEPKYQLLIKKREKAGMYLDNPNPKAFIEYSNTMDDVYNNINDHNPKRKYLVFITQSYFLVPKEVRLNSTHDLIMKIPNKK